jgi:hypothetical protein
MTTRQRYEQIICCMDWISKEEQQELLNSLFKEEEKEREEN